MTNNSSFVELEFGGQSCFALTNKQSNMWEIEFHSQEFIANTSSARWIQLDPASHQEVLRLERRVSIHRLEFLIVLIAVFIVCRGLLKRIEKLEKKGGDDK